MRKFLGKFEGKRRKRAAKTIAFALAGAALLGAAGCSERPKVEVPADAVIRLSDQFSSDFALIDAEGRAVADEDFRGRVMLVYFGFTHCPDVCPLALGTLSAALNELDEKERAEIAPIFISVDPERDTPAVVKAYLSFDERLIGLTGAPEAAEAARLSFKVAARKQELPGSALGYEVQHTSLFYLVDRSGRPVLALRDSVSPEQLAEMLRRSIKG